MDETLDFRRVEYPEPHKERTRRLLAAHPEAKALQGPEPWSIPILLGVVAFQIGLAWVLRDQSLWLVIPLAWLVGAVADHALWVLIHEASHNLLVRTPWVNSVGTLVANLPIVFPGGIPFRRYHLLHHAWQGDPEIDADLASPAEARFVGRSTVRKAIWLLFYFLAQALRTPQLRRIRLWDGWYVANLLIQVAFSVAVIHFAGWTAFLYLLLSSMFAIGLHPVGARWIQEHYLTFPGNQETFSYYGPMNVLALNVGYHNEHHDLMRVPWTRLPALKRMAPELYEPLQSHRSWSALLWRFLTDPSITLYSRVVRHGTTGTNARMEPAA